MSPSIPICRKWGTRTISLKPSRSARCGIPLFLRTWPKKLSSKMWIGTTNQRGIWCSSVLSRKTRRSILRSFSKKRIQVCQGLTWEEGRSWCPKCLGPARTAGWRRWCRWRPLRATCRQIQFIYLSTRTSCRTWRREGRNKSATSR